MIVTLETSKEEFTKMEWRAAEAALTCHANVEKMSAEGYKPSDTLKNIIKWGHESVLEHINLSFHVKPLSRACLQELARHRHISLSVESTRHTLKEQIKSDKIIFVFHEKWDKELKIIIAKYLETLCDYVRNNPDVPNDFLKYALPECVCTNLVMTVNVRELRHIIKVRNHPAALEEFQVLSRQLYEVVPDEFKYLLEDCLYEGKKENE